MKLVVGLGNPGQQYEQTRHNVGFRIVDKLAEKQGWSWSERRGKAILANGNLLGEKIALLKPLTFMNLSGEAVGEVVRWHKIQPEDLLIIFDDLDLPTGKVRLRARGSSGGHNGLKDIIAKLHTSDFSRLRVGIGRPKNSQMQGRDYVLSAAHGDDGILLDTGEERAIAAVKLWIEKGAEATMNIVNMDPEEAERKAEELARKKREREEREQQRRAAESSSQDSPSAAD